MTLKTQQALLNKTVNVRFESLTIRCRILDVKNAYGNTRYLTEPLKGFGNQWVDASRVQKAEGDNGQK